MLQRGRRDEPLKLQPLRVVQRGEVAVPLRQIAAAACAQRLEGSEASVIRWNATLRLCESDRAAKCELSRAEHWPAQRDRKRRGQPQYGQAQISASAKFQGRDRTSDDLRER